MPGNGGRGGIARVKTDSFGNCALGYCNAREPKGGSYSELNTNSLPSGNQAALASVICPVWISSSFPSGL